jgi:cytochrome b561
MFRRTAGLWVALLAIAAATAIYLFAYFQSGGLPRASGWVGHGIGVTGFVLMLMTETLYSMRKLTTDARWGSMASWLQFHMATGIAGPYMVLLHTSMKFNGLAGVAMLLTVVVVVSGIVGRYLYTKVPRVIDGAPAQGDADVARLESRRRALATWYSVHVPLTWALFVTAVVHMGAALFYGTLQR